MLERLKELNSALDITKRTGYIFEKKIFAIAMILLLLPVGFVFYYNNGYKYEPYLLCEEGSCPNPFYNKCDWKWCCEEEWCRNEFVYAGEYGKKPLKIINLFDEYMIVVMALAFLINHFRNNKGFNWNQDFLGEEE